MSLRLKYGLYISVAIRVLYVANEEQTLSDAFSLCCFYLFDMIV
jgi:hypothetical protein